MLTKNWNPQTERFDVTFDLPAEIDIEQAAVVGEFNDWSESADPMAKESDGRWSATVSLEPSTSYRFRYHLGADRWENDWNADHYVGNDFGGADSVVVVPERPSAPPPAKAAAPKQAATPKKAAGKKTASTKKAAPAEKVAPEEQATPKKAAGKKAAPAKKAAGKKAAPAKRSAKKAGPSTS